MVLNYNKIQFQKTKSNAIKKSNLSYEKQSKNVMAPRKYH
jgi:hypothetical protein